MCWHKHKISLIMQQLYANKAIQKVEPQRAELLLQIIIIQQATGHWNILSCGNLIIRQHPEKYDKLTVHKIYTK